MRRSKPVFLVTAIIVFLALSFSAGFYFIYFGKDKTSVTNGKQELAEYIIDLKLPFSSWVKLQGRDFGAVTEPFKFKIPVSDLPCTVPLEISYPSGETSQYSLLLDDNRRIQLTLRNLNSRIPELVFPIGHSGYINSVAFSPDSQTILTGSDDKKAILWDVQTGQKLRTLREDEGVKCVAYSPDGQTVFVGLNNHCSGLRNEDFSEDTKNSAFLWNIQTGKRLQALEGYKVAIQAASFSPDSCTLLTGSCDGESILWDVETGQRIRELGEFIEGCFIAIGSNSFSSDGKIVSGTYGETITSWDVETGQKLHAVEISEDGDMLLGPTSFGADAKTVMVGSNSKKAAIWNIDKSQKIRTFNELEHSISSVALSPNCQTAFTASIDRLLALWDVQTGKRLRTLNNGEEYVQTSSFSPDGKILFTAFLDGTASLWNVQNGEKIQNLKGNIKKVRSIRFSPDGQTLLLLFSDNTVDLWDLKLGRKRKTLKVETDPRAFVVYSPDAQNALIRSDESSLALWDVQKGRKIRDFEKTDKITSISFSSDSQLALTGSDNGFVTLWNVQTGCPIRTFREYGQNGIDDAVLSPDGKFALAIVNDKIAVLWDVQTGHQLWKYKSDGLLLGSNAFALSPDSGTVLINSWGASVVLLDLHSGNLLRKFEDKSMASSWVVKPRGRDVTFSSNGRTFLEGLSDGTAILWNVKTGKKLRTFRGNLSCANSVALSPNNQMAVIGSPDGRITVWSMATGENLLTLFSFDNQQDWLAASPEGYFDGSPGGRKKLNCRIGHGLKVVPAEPFAKDFYQAGLFEMVLRGEKPLQTKEAEDL